MLFQYYPQVQHNFSYELNKDMHFAGAHFIPHEMAGKCQQMHGHTYVVNVTIGGDQLDAAGFLVDFKELKDMVHGQYDHTLMNDHPHYKDRYPTTEIVAETIYTIIQKALDLRDNQARCLQVLVRETPTSYVVYRPKKSAAI